MRKVYIVGFSMYYHMKAKKSNKIKETKEKLIAEIEESMKDPEIRKGIRQFVRATSC